LNFRKKTGKLSKKSQNRQRKLTALSKNVKVAATKIKCFHSKQVFEKHAITAKKREMTSPISSPKRMWRTSQSDVFRMNFKK